MAVGLLAKAQHSGSLPWLGAAGFEADAIARKSENQLIGVSAGAGKIKHARRRRPNAVELWELYCKGLRRTEFIGGHVPN